MTVKAIIFDFDGTIADTHGALIEITNGLATKFGYDPVEPEELSELKKLSSREIIKKSKISPLKIPFLLKKVQAELGKIMSDLKPLQEIEKYLWELKKEGYLLGIVTSNNQENVKSFLKNNQMEGIFTFIYSGTPLFGKHKSIKRLLGKNRFNPEEVIYVGDETRDIEAAKKCKIKIVAVSWGFSSASILEKYNPDFLIEHPRELLSVVDSEKSRESEALIL